MAKTNNKSKLILFTILIVASFLRLWKLSDVPVSLFEDELDVGYHAYSILKTGKDHAGNSWPLHFESRADWRTPFNIYSTVPTVAIFGITPLGIRLPVAFFGILGVWGFYLLVKQLTNNEKLSLVSCAILALSPWHIQYSRVALEVSQLLTFLIFGLYFFFRALQTKKQNSRSGKWFCISVVCLTLTPLVYSTAKLFAPVLMLSLFILYRRDIAKLPKKYLGRSLFLLITIGSLIVYSTLFTGGGYRFKYISIFTDPVVSTEVDFARFYDSNFRNEIEPGIVPKIQDRLYHNKAVYWVQSFVKNYLKAFSTDFLFINGDPNLRHSIKNMGQFYKVESIAMLLGAVLFFSCFKNKKLKIFVTLWIFAGIVPSAITRIGGNHSTRLILILPPLVFLVAYGFVEGLSLVKNTMRRYLLTTLFFGIWLLSFFFYQHNFWVHYPWDSERMWHAGYREVIDVAKKYESQYQKIIFSNALENPSIFFAAYYGYDPALWQKSLKRDWVSGFGEIEHAGMFYFGQVIETVGVQKLSDYMDTDTLYIALQKEIGANLVMEPEKTPVGLELIETIRYPSGEPAFYALARKANK